MKNHTCPHHSGIVAAILLAASLLAVISETESQAADAAQGSGRWSGAWATYWPGGGAQLVLAGSGDQVTGTYLPGDGTILGTVVGDELSGTWQDRSGTGTFQIRLAADGATFFGRFGSGLWWTGERSGTADISRALRADLTSPRSVTRSFLLAANSVRVGHLDNVASALDCLVQYPLTDRVRGRGDRDRSQLFYEVIDRTTIRLADIPGQVDGSEVVLSLSQAGSDEKFQVRATRQAEGWRLVVPDEADLRDANRRFLQARGQTVTHPERQAPLASPRATMRTFLERYKEWDSGGSDLIKATMDFSGVNAALVKTEFPILATYLKETLDRVGYVIYQEIPDDPYRRIPYLHFRHPRGEIVLAPVQKEDGVVWQFTPQTLAGIRTLYEAVENQPLASVLIPQQFQAFYFQLNQFVRHHMPGLLAVRFGGLKDWQWLAVLVTVLLSVVVAFGFDLGSRVIVRRSLRRHTVTIDGRLRRRLFAPLAVTLGVGIGYLCATNIGLPLGLFPPLHTMVSLIVAIGLAWTAFNAAGLVQDYFKGLAEKTVSYYDELMVSVVGGLVKVVIAVLGILYLAREIGIPVGGVVAGFGAGGFAFAIAAKDTLANIIGSGVLLADRPFKRGDLVEVAGHRGYIERMGLRSTQMRTHDDSVVSIPNNLLVNEFIDNMGRRRFRSLQARVGVTYDTPADKLDAFAEGLMETMRNHPHVSTAKMSAGVWEFAESSIDFEFFCYLDVPSGSDERSERHKLFVSINRLAERLGIALAFPTRTIHFADPDQARFSAGGEGKTPAGMPPAAGS